MQTHLFSYRHEGKLWELEIQARDADDARRRIGQLAYATYDGVLVTKVPLALGPLAIFTAWMRNATRTLVTQLRQKLES
jgi:hypothetical protein